jgi:dTMP kinase
VEGIDGSGKGTQANKLATELTGRGIKTKLFSFPAYTTTMAGGLIGRYLNGDFGSNVSPFLSWALFALDRFEHYDSLCDALDHNDVVICDRYVYSNVAHQCANVGDESERALLADVIKHMEFSVMCSNQPDLVIYLDLDVEAAMLHVAKKLKRDYTDKHADLHEADEAHLRNALAEYRKMFEKSLTRDSGPEWYKVNVSCAGHIRSIDDIHTEIIGLVSPKLATL